MIVVGLTGSVGTGKSSVGRMFSRLGVPVFEADAIVRGIYRSNQEVIGQLSERLPSVVDNGVVCRGRLSRHIQFRPQDLEFVESVVHRHVRLEEVRIIEREKRRNRPLIVLSIPLLFETGANNLVHKVIVTSCSPEKQRQRVLSRPGMTEELFKLYTGRQWSDQRKRERADFVLSTECSLRDTAGGVAQIVRTLLGGNHSSLVQNENRG